MSPSGQKLKHLEGAYYADSKTDIIYFIQSIEGRYIKFSCRTTSITTAKRFASKTLKQKLGKNKKSRAPLLGYWIDRYLESRLKEDLGSTTQKNIRNAVKQFKPFWESMRPEEVTRETYEQFYEWFKDTWSFQFDNCFKYFKNFLNWMKDAKYMGLIVPMNPPTIRNPEAKKNRQARKKKKERTFEGWEFEKIYKAANEKEKLLVLLMYTMAFRVESDALSARWAQFKLSGKNPVYVFGEFDNKAGLEGQQAIHTVTLEHLKEWKKKTGHSEWVFPQKSDPAKHIKSQMIDWDGLRERANLGWHWTPHTFRHSCFTQLVGKGYPLHYISKCYRISPAELMNTYAHLTPDGIEQMRDAMELKKQ